MTILKKLGVSLFCTALALSNTNITYASTDVIQINDETDITNLEPGTYQVSEKSSDGTLTTTYTIGDVFTVNNVDSLSPRKTIARSARSSGTLHGRNLKQTNEYVNVDGILIYETVNDASFYWDGTNVWVSSHNMTEKHLSGYSKNVTSTAVDSSKSPRQVAWSRYHVTYSYGSTVLNSVNDVGCSRFGDPNYIKELE